MDINSNMSPGKLYEQAIFTHTLINNKDKKFDLGMEIKLGDKFDDLVIRVDGNKYTLVQIKLVDDIDVNVIDSKVLLGEKRISLKNDDFNLQRYLVSYLRIKDQLYAKDRNSAIQKLIIFTNAHLDDKDVGKVFGNIKRIKLSNDNILNTEENSEYFKIHNVSNGFIKKIMENLKSDLQILVEELAKYVSDNNINNEPMVLDIDCLRYYHMALISEKVMEVRECQHGNKKIKLGKFTQNFIDGKELSDRAQRLRSKLIEIVLEKQDNISKLHSKAEWKLSEDFGTEESNEVKFVPNFKITGEDVKKFFDVLELRVNQCGVKDILAKIKNEEIRNRFLEYFDTDTKLVEFLIADFIQSWRRDTTAQERWLLNSKRSQFIKELLIKIAKPQAIHRTKKHIQYVESIVKKFSLHFLDDCSFNEKYFLTKKILLIRTASNILSSIKMLEYLKKTKHQSYFFIDIESLCIKREIMKQIDAFRDNKYSLFIFSYKFLMQDDIINEVFNKLSSIIKGNNKQVVFITSTADSLIKKFSCVEEYIDTVSGIEDFVDSSKLLAQQITIQGQNMQIGALYKQIGPKIIDRLITNKIVIGDTISKMNYSDGAFFELFEEIDMKSFRHALFLQKSSNTYIINGIPGSWKVDRLFKELGISETSIVNSFKNEIEPLDQNSPRTLNGRIYVSGNQIKDREFREISRYNAEKNIYLINIKYECDKSKFILAQIYNPDFYIKGARFNNVVKLNNCVKNQLASCNLCERFLISGKNKKETESWLQLNIDEKKHFKTNCDNKKILLTPKQENPSVNFQELVEQNLDETLHMLKFEQDELIWCKTYGSLKNLSTYRTSVRNRNTQNLLEEDDIIKEIKDKQVVIIAGDPGIGKSTAMFKLLYSSKYNFLSDTGESINMSHWVIKVKLKDHLQIIRDIDFNQHDEILVVKAKIIRFLSQIDKSIDHEDAKYLFDAALMKQDFGKPLLIAFDGFDEILDEQDRVKVMLLFKQLKYKTKAKFWVTTRLHYENTLENELSTFAIRLEAMDVENVRLFIKTYLKNHLSLTLNYEDFTSIFEDINEKENGRVLHKYAEAFVNKMQEIFKFDISWFIGTPLQLYLLLEGSSKYFRKWVNNYRSETPDFSYLGNNIWEVYENFIERKYDTYFTKRDVKEHVKQKLEKTVLNNFHKDIAKSSLIDLQAQIHFTELKDIVLSAGIIKSDGINIEFIHPTFREYYAAQTFLYWIENWTRNVVNIQESIYFFQDILSNPLHQVIRAFLNIKLLQKEHGYENSLHLQAECYNKHILYLAFGENNFGIANFLINIPNFRSINTEAIYDSESPLKYAAFYGNIERLELIVKYCTNIDPPNKLYSSVLHVAVESGQLEMVIFLVENGADINARNVDSETALVHLFNVSRSPWSLQSDLQIAKFLVQNGAYVNCCDKQGEPVICIAASKRGNLDKVKFLLENGADANYKSENGNAALVCAFKHGDLEIIKCLVENGANVNVKDNKGETVLCKALYIKENLEIIKFFVESGADVHATGIDGMSILHRADFLNLSSDNNQQIYRFLIQKGLKINTRIEADRLILKKVARSGNLDLLKSLIENRINNEHLELCPFLLHVAAQSNNFHMVKFLVENDAFIKSSKTAVHTVFDELADFKIVNYLIHNSTNFNARDKDGFSVLHYAAKCDNFEMVKFFVQNGANFNARDKNGFVVLHYAAKCNNLEMIKFLVENGANVKYKAMNGMTVLHCALLVSHAKLDVVQYLVEQGVEINTTTIDRQSALYLATTYFHDQIVPYLLRAGADIKNSYSETTLGLAEILNPIKIIQNGLKINTRLNIDSFVLKKVTRSGCLDLLKSLLETRANNDNLELCPLLLHVAAQSNNLDMVKFLVENDAFVNSDEIDFNEVTDFQIIDYIEHKSKNFNTRDAYGHTALHYAAKSNNLEMIKFFIENGADIKCKTINGMTVLHCALFVTHAKLDVVQYLVEQGVKVNATTNDRQSALHLAVLNFHDQIVPYLLGAGADITLKNSNRETALDLAELTDQKEIITLLKCKNNDKNSTNSTKHSFLDGS